MRTIAIKEFEPALAARLPETFALLERVGLVVHPAVTQITLHGSRGLAGNFRLNSDIDLSLLVSPAAPPVVTHLLEKLLKEVLTVTSLNWNAPVELDLAVVFPFRVCWLACFQVGSYAPFLCPSGAKTVSGDGLHLYA